MEIKIQKKKFFHYLKLEFLIAWRYLRAKRREGGVSTIAWFSFLGVALGVATLIVVQAVMVGFKEEFTDRIIGANPHLVIYKSVIVDVDKIINIKKKARTHDEASCVIALTPHMKLCKQTDFEILRSTNIV